MSFSNKYSKYIVLVIIVIAGAYGVWSLYLNPSRPQGMEIRILLSASGGNFIYQTVYDTALPSDLNYTSIYMNNRVEFIAPVNASEYAKGITNEQIIRQFNDKQSLKIWLDTVQMPNFIRNTLKALLDISIPELNKIYTDPNQGIRTIGGMSQLSAIGGATYIFSGLIYAYENPILTLKLCEDYVIPHNQKMVWELVIKLPKTGTDYEVIFTRMPKP